MLGVVDGVTGGAVEVVSIGGRCGSGVTMARVSVAMLTSMFLTVTSGGVVPVIATVTRGGSRQPSRPSVSHPSTQAHMFVSRHVPWPLHCSGQSGGGGCVVAVVAGVAGAGVDGIGVGGRGVGGTGVTPGGGIGVTTTAVVGAAVVARVVLVVLVVVVAAAVVGGGVPVPIVNQRLTSSFVPRTNENL
jgi:hypothetical protein